MNNKITSFLKITFAVFLLYLHSKWLTDENYFLPVIDHVNLAFHEAGHVFTSFFGKFINMSGGTISQIFFPSLCEYHLYKQENKFGFQLCLWWIGENLLNISIYIADANKLKLPLVGGGEHDWAYILSKFGLLNNCDAISKAVFISGSIIMLYSVYLIIKDALSSTQQQNNVNV